MVRQRGHFGILRDLQKAIEHYTGIKVYLRSLDDGYSITMDKGLGEDPLGIFIPKEGGTVDEELFNAAVAVLGDLLKESAA